MCVVIHQSPDRPAGLRNERDRQSDLFQVRFACPGKSCGQTASAGHRRNYHAGHGPFRRADRICSVRKDDFQPAVGKNHRLFRNF